MLSPNCRPACRVLQSLDIVVWVIGCNQNEEYCTINRARFCNGKQLMSSLPQRAHFMIVDTALGLQAVCVLVSHVKRVSGHGPGARSERM